VFSVAEFGEITYALVVAIITGLIVDFGYVIYLPKESANKSNVINELVASSMAIKIILALLSLLFILLGHFFGFIVGELKLILTFSISAVLVSFASSFLLPYRSLNRFQVESKYIMIQHISLSVLVIAVLFFIPDVYIISLVYLLVRFIYCMLAYNNYRIEFNFSWKLELGMVGELKKVAPYAIHAIIATLLVQIDTLILANYVDSAQIGIYQAGMRFVMATSIFITIFYDVLIPKFSLAVSGDKHVFFVMVKKFNWLIIVIGAIGSLFLYTFSEFIVLIVYGQSMYELNQYIGLFSLFIFLRFFGVTYNSLLTSTGNQQKRAIFLAITLVVIIILESWLIPIYHISGALFSLIVGHILLYTMTMLLTYQQFGTLFLFRRLKL
jgi:O-antigen/teichoic acid export membrane protein